MCVWGGGGVCVCVCVCVSSFPAQPISRPGLYRRPRPPHPSRPRPAARRRHPATLPPADSVIIQTVYLYITPPPPPTQELVTRPACHRRITSGSLCAIHCGAGSGSGRATRGDRFLENLSPTPPPIPKHRPTVKDRGRRFYTCM